MQDHYLDVREKLFRDAQQLIDAWNAAEIIDKRVILSAPNHVYDETAGETCLAEPFIQNFQKFNSNTGWEAPQGDQYSEAMQALSHFSYIKSCGMMVLCDIQGGIYQDKM